MKMSKINMRANMMTHGIAKFSFDNRSDGILFNIVLPCVAQSVMNDFTNVLN